MLRERPNRLEHVAVCHISLVDGSRINAFCMLTFFDKCSMQNFYICRRTLTKSMPRNEACDIANDDRVLSFPLDVLRAAGVSLGEVRSTLTPPVRPLKTWHGVPKPC
jgi:hypothetical protein